MSGHTHKKKETLLPGTDLPEGRNYFHVQGDALTWFWFKGETFKLTIRYKFEGKELTTDTAMVYSHEEQARQEAAQIFTHGIIDSEDGNIPPEDIILIDLVLVKVKDENRKDAL